MQILAQDFLLPDYVFLAVGRVGSTSENIKQKILYVNENEKRSALVELLENHNGNLVKCLQTCPIHLYAVLNIRFTARESLTLIFVETKRGASDLAYFLQKQDYPVAAIHGDLKQFERERHLELFRNGQNTILVATAVSSICSVTTYWCLSIA